MTNNMFMVDSQPPLKFLGEMPKEKFLDAMIFILPRLEMANDELAFGLVVSIITEFKQRMVDNASFVTIIEDRDKNNKNGWVVRLLSILFTMWKVGTIHEYEFKDKRIIVFWGQDINIVHRVSANVERDVRYDQQDFILYWVDLVTKEGDTIVDPLSYYGRVGVASLYKKRFAILNEVLEDTSSGVNNMLKTIEEKVLWKD